MITKSPTRKSTNRRLGRHPAVRKNQHLLDVKVRAHTARRQRNSRVGGLLFWGILLCGVCVGGYFGTTYLLNRFFFQNPAYALSRLDLELDESMSREEFLERTGIQEGSNIFSINLAKVESRLSRNPHVIGVKIERELPDKLSVHVTQRHPVAWIATGDGDAISPDNGYLVGADGMLMKAKAAKAPEYVSLPVIKNLPKENLHEGETPDNRIFRAVLELITKNNAMPDTLLQIREIDLVKDYRMDVLNEQNAHIYFGLTDIDEQLNKLNLLLTHCRETHRQIESVNLMIKRNMPVRFVMAEASVPVTSSAKAPAAPTKQSSKSTRIQ